MRRALLALMFAGAIAGGGMAAAQAPGGTADDHAAHHPAKASPAAPAAAAKPAPAPADHGGGMCPMCSMKGGAGTCPMMGGGPMGGHMMGGMGPGMGQMMGGANTKVDVKKVDKGVTITLTSADPATAVRLQKMAEAMRLMHEATTP